MQEPDHVQQSYEALDEALSRIKYLVLRSLTPEGRHHVYQLARASGALIDALSVTHSTTPLQLATQQLQALTAEPRDALLRRYVAFRQPRRVRTSPARAARKTAEQPPQARVPLLMGLLGAVVLMALVL